MSKMNKQTNLALNILFTYGCLAASSLAVYYCFQNPTGHGWEPLWLLFGAVPVLLFGFIGTWIAKSSHYKETIAASTFAIAFGVLTHMTFIMRGYESWASSGLPEPPSYRVGFLQTFLVLLALLIVVSTVSFLRLKLWRKKL